MVEIVRLLSPWCVDFPLGLEWPALIDTAQVMLLGLYDNSQSIWYMQADESCHFAPVGHFLVL